MIDQDGISAAGPEVDDRVDIDAGVVIYERLLPALAGSVGQIRHELADVLSDHGLAAERLGDIALVVSEAANNVVLHAYLDAESGPLLVAATLTGSELAVSVTDSGRGMLPRLDSPGLGFGVALMTRFADEFRIDSDNSGTIVHATFNQVCTPRKIGWGAPLRPIGDRAEMLQEYLRVLTAAHESLKQDTQAVLAQAKQTIAHARRLQRDRAAHH
jgi:anti-sigma regulatory factor (Ser/Thr protein kinase)